MPISVVDLYKTILPKTNCGDCGFPTCLAFAGMVVSEGIPLKSCPHVVPENLPAAQAELDQQRAQGKWTKRDPAGDALQWAKQRAASMKISDLPQRIGGRLVRTDGEDTLELPYFRDTLIIRSDHISQKSAEPLNRWEQVFIYNHLPRAEKRNRPVNGKVSWNCPIRFPKSSP
jgi:hypothetical protein